MVEEAIEQEVREQQAFYEEENMKEAILEQVLQEEGERQYYQQLMAEEALRQVEQQQLQFQQEEIEFAEEALKTQHHLAQQEQEQILSHDGFQDESHIPFDDHAKIYSSPRFIEDKEVTAVEIDDEDQNIKSIITFEKNDDDNDDGKSSMISESPSQSIMTSTNNTAFEIDDDEESLEPPPSNKIAPKRPNIDNNNITNQEQNKSDNNSEIKTMESNHIPSTHKILSRILPKNDDLSVNILQEQQEPPHPPVVRQSLLSQFSVDESSLESVLVSPVRSPPPPLPTSTMISNQKLAPEHVHNNQNTNQNNNNNNQQQHDGIISPDLSLCSSSIGYQENTDDINDVNTINDDDVNDIKPRSLRFNDDQLIQNENDQNEQNEEEMNKKFSQEQKNQENQILTHDIIINNNDDDDKVQEELNDKNESSDCELPSTSNWPDVSHNVAASMAIGGSNQAPSTPPKRSRIPRLRKQLQSKYSLSYLTAVSSNQHNNPPGVLVDEHGKFISASVIVANNDDENDNDDDGFLSGFLVASGVTPVLSIRVTANLRKTNHKSINPQSLTDKTNRMNMSQILKDAGLKPSHIRNIFVNAEKAYGEESGNVVHQQPENDDHDDDDNDKSSPKKLNLNKLKNKKMKKKNSNINDMNRTAQVMTPPIVDSSVNSNNNSGVVGGHRKKSYKKPSVDPTEWARKRKEKAEKAKEARDSRLFGM
jgi:hypothetical protein